MEIPDYYTLWRRNAERAINGPVRDRSSCGVVLATMSRSERNTRYQSFRAHYCVSVLTAPRIFQMRSFGLPSKKNKGNSRAKVRSRVLSIPAVALLIRNRTGYGIIQGALLQTPGEWVYKFKKMTPSIL